MRNTELRDLCKLYQDSHRYRRHLYSDQVWERLENYWKGIYPASGDILCVPILVSDAQRQKSAIMGGQPRVTVTSDQAELVPTARVLTSQLNHLVRTTRLYDELNDAVQDALTLGTGILIDGFGSQYGVSPNTVLEGYDPSAQGEDNRRLEYHDNVFQDLPWSLRVHPSDIYFPPGAVRPAGLYGFFHRYVRHIDEVSQDTKLNQHRTKIKPNAAASYQLGGLDQQMVTLEDLVVLVDWYDLRNSHRVTFCEDYPYPLADHVDELLIRIDRLPLHVVIFNRNSRFIWGTSDFALQEPLAAEVNDIRTMQKRLRAQQICKGVYNKDMLLEPGQMNEMENAIRALTTDQVMSMLGVSGDPNAFFAEIKPSQPYDLIPQVNLAKDEIENFGGGIGPNQRGQLAGGRHTKYEVQRADSHFDAAMMPRRQVIGQRIIDIVTNWASYIQDFWTEPRLVRTRDAAGRPVVVQFEGADLRGDFRYEVSIESLRSKGPDERVAEANMIYERCMPFVQQGLVDPQALLLQFLSRIDTEWDIDSLVGGPGQQAGAALPFGQYQQQFMQQAQQLGGAANPQQLLQMAQNQRALPGQGPGGPPPSPGGGPTPAPGGPR